MGQYKFTKLNLFVSQTKKRVLYLFLKKKMVFK